MTDLKLFHHLVRSERVVQRSRAEMVLRGTIFCMRELMRDKRDSTGARKAIIHRNLQQINLITAVWVYKGVASLENCLYTIIASHYIQGIFTPKILS